MDNNLLVKNTYQYLEIESKEAMEFWIGLSSSVRANHALDLVDCLYCIFLCGRLNSVEQTTVDRYLEFVNSLNLYGRTSTGDEALSCHLTAYLLGGIQLLKNNGYEVNNRALYENWSVDLLIDKRTFLPKWPTLWSHHSWRVSHWVGGAPSILLHLGRSQMSSNVNEDLTKRVLDACEGVVIDSNGLLKTYKSNLLQRVFKLLYAIRHNPQTAEIGGVVHLLWSYHVLDRKIISPEILEGRTKLIIEKANPFIEAVPYCLDFDVIQLFRVLSSNRKLRQPEIDRIEAYRAAIVDFFCNDVLDSSYSVHKLPGALAALHECSLLLGQSNVYECNTSAKDIIKEAYWI